MSCESSAISTVWTTTTSNVPATVTSIHTSVISPTASVHTSLTTSCLATRSTDPIPTARLIVSSRDNNSSVLASSRLTTGKDDLVVSGSRTESSDKAKGTDEAEDGEHRKFSLWNLLVAAKEQKRDTHTLAPRQIPSSLPSNCISWTIKSSLSTPAVTPSTSFATSTVVTTTQSVVWVPKETIWASCDGTKTVAASSQTWSPTSTTDGSSANGSSGSSSVTSSSISSSESSSVSQSGDASTQTTDAGGTSDASSSQSDTVSATESSTEFSSAEAPSTTSKQWIDEASRLESMASSLSSLNGTGASTLLSGVSTYNSSSSHTSTSGSTTSVVPMNLLPTSTTSHASSSATSSSSVRSKSTASGTSSADAGAATQGALAVEDKNDKAVSVGATIGGIIGLFGLIALILMSIRWYMRWKRGNKRKTLKMRQSWYPAGYDGPDHIAPSPAPNEKQGKHGQAPDQSHFSFFSMGGRNQSTGNQPGSKRFPGLNVPQLGFPFFPYSKNNRNELEDNENDLPPGSSNPLHMPAIFAGPLSKMKPTRMFPTLATPFSPRRAPDHTPAWAEKYVDEPLDAPPAPMAKNRDVNPPRSIMMRPPDFDGVVGPPKLNYEPPATHMSWGLPRDGTNAGPDALARRPKLEWGHSYAASSLNPNPRQSLMPQPPLPKPFIPGPQIPPSPTEESVYSKRESQHSRASRQSARQSRQSNQHQNRYSIYNHGNNEGLGYSLTPGTGLNRQPSSNRSSNPDLRSAILSRASASAASLGGWSIHSGVSEHSLPPLPEGGLRFDFPLPPTPGSRAATMVSVPEPRTQQAQPDRPRVSPRKDVPQSQSNMQSSVFEYEDYSRQSTAAGPNVPPTSARSAAGGRSESGRDTIRQTANWYEKPLWIWDGQSGPLPRIPTDNGMLDGSAWRQSQKTVRWDPADGVARAL